MFISKNAVSSPVELSFTDVNVNVWPCSFSEDMSHAHDMGRGWKRLTIKNGPLSHTYQLQSPDGKQYRVSY